MASVSKVRKKRTHFVIKLLFVLFAVYAAVTLVSLQLQIRAKSEEIDSLAQQVDQQQAENEQTRTEVEQGANEETVAAVAREKLGYVSPGERVFVDTSTK